MRKGVPAMRRVQSKKLAFESLESRAMLAGDVSVSISDDGVLLITGDEEGNHIVIEGTVIPGAVIVAPGEGTTINDLSTPIVVRDVRSIDADLVAGDDTLEINNVDVLDLIVTMDEGADVVRMGAYAAFATRPAAITPGDGSVRVDGFLGIDTGGGADLIELVAVDGVADWNVFLGDADGTNNNTDDRDDNDLFVDLDDQLYIFIGAAELIEINGGTGDDLVNINYLRSNGLLDDPLLATLLVDGFEGNDVLSVNGSAFQDNVVLLGGSGLDTIALDFSRHDAGLNARIEIDAGDDDDFVLFARSLIGEGEIFIRSGAGFDNVVIGRYYANAAGDLTTGGNLVGTLMFDAGGDADRADIRGNDILEFLATFGSGNDELDFINNVVQDGGVLDGGTGFDGLTFTGNIVENFGINFFEEQDGIFDDDF
jgi:hypothetical protein